MDEVELDLTDFMYAMRDITIEARNSWGKDRIAYMYYVWNQFGLFNIVFDELLYIVFMTMTKR